MIGMGDLDTLFQCGEQARPEDLPIQVASIRSGRPGNSGSRRSAGPACASGVGVCKSCSGERMGDQSQADLQNLQGVGHATQEQGPRRPVKAKLREDRVEASGRNQVWAMDFVHDRLATGRKIRVLAVVHKLSRYSPSARRQVQLPRRRRGRHPGEGVLTYRLSEDDPRRSELGVHLSRHRPIGPIAHSSYRPAQPARNAD